MGIALYHDRSVVTTIGHGPTHTMSEAKQEAVVISDLHLFSRRSEFDSHADAVHHAAAQCDLFILNGDTFDFLPLSKATIAYPMSVLAGLTAALLIVRTIAPRPRDDSAP